MQAEEGAVKEALAQLLASARATRNALISKQDEQIKAIELQHDGYKETALMREKKIADRQAASRAAAAALLAALFQRKEAVGGATAKDGAAALAAVAGLSGRSEWRRLLRRVRRPLALLRRRRPMPLTT